MTRPQILLDPVDFDALHLSALVHGGIGGFTTFDKEDAPLCKIGHLAGMDPYFGADTRSYEAGLTVLAQDDALRSIGVAPGERIPFEQYIALLNIDIKPTSEVV